MRSQSCMPSDGQANGGELSSRMSKMDEYQRRRETCEANAASAPSPELGDIWRTIAMSYAFLVELELRRETGPLALPLPGKQ
jgi:hypothetical protein